jgi:hypothetical protein
LKRNLHVSLILLAIAYCTFERQFPLLTVVPRLFEPRQLSQAEIHNLPQGEHFFVALEHTLHDEFYLYALELPAELP